VHRHAVLHCIKEYDTVSLANTVYPSHEYTITTISVFHVIYSSDTSHVLIGSGLLEAKPVATKGDILI